ncbi:MAG: outer membrane protein assembly factor BamD [Nitrospira sp.]|nr:MAG: outer membrane protein assembly factor BamD [Nitrospira sp.]
MVACSGTPKDMRQPEAAKKAVGGIDEQIFLDDTVERHYHPNVIMKRGEAFFDRGEYAEALVEYNHFLDLHRTHVLAPYAAYRIGEIHFKKAKSIDRDPEPMQQAITALERMRKDFPGSRYDAQAQQKIQECHDWLAQMHLFVGQFYYRRGSYLAAAHRFEQIIKSYPDKPVAPDALYFLAMAYHELGADDWARDNLVLLAEKYPGSKVSKDGKKLLAKLGGAQPGTLLAQKSDSVAFSDIGPTAGRSARPEAPDQPSIPSPSQIGSLRIPSANALGQTFTACRLGAWC